MSTTTEAFFTVSDRDFAELQQIVSKDPRGYAKSGLIRRLLPAWLLDKIRLTGF